MRLVRHIIFIACLVMAAAGAALTAQQHFAKPEDQLGQVIFWALLLVAGVGSLSFVVQFFAERAAQVLSCLFFGFLAGIMATNFVTDIASGTTFPSVTGYLTSYGLELFFLALSIVGLVLFQPSGAKTIAELGAAQNVGQTKVPCKSEATVGPSSVS